MDLDFLLQEKDNSATSFIQKDIDAAKYDEVAAKLCDKRIAIEKILKDETASPEAREENALSLIQIKKDLTLFGISEIDYQAYVTQKESTSTQLELF